jgi:hypothetical protein
MDCHLAFGKTGTLFGFPEGALDASSTHGTSGGRAVLLITSSRGKEPGRVVVGFPRGSEQSQGLFGQGDRAVFGALATVARDLEALALDVSDLKREGFVEPEAQTRDGGAGDLIVQGRS